jgi:peptide/nickel transport system substrate-binding protein
MPSSRIALGLQRRATRAALACALAALACTFACREQRTDEGAQSALVVLLPREAQEIDPRFSGDAYGHKVSRLLFASLVTIDPHSLEVVPDLAEHVEVVTPSSYRVRLRAGLRFSDGSALDAQDVAATYRSVVDPKLATRYARTYQRIARVQVVDPLTVVFELDGPHATFLTDLELPILRAEDEHRQIGAIGGAAPIGAGPYVLAHRDAGVIDLAPNRNWHRGRPRHPRVRLLVVRDDNTRALRLLAGAADLALNAIPPLLLPLFEQDSRFTIQRAPGVGTTYLGLNLEADAVRDPRVRRAIAHAIDREALIRAKLDGKARLASGWIVPGHWAHDRDLPQYAYDPARARALLREAERARGARGPLPALTLRCGSDRLRQSIARAIVTMLADVGLMVELRPSEVATLIADLNRGRFELTMLEVPEVVEPHVLTWFFGSESVPGGGREGSNRWRLRNRALDEALERGRASIERSARIAAYVEAQAILARELPVIPLWHQDVVQISAPRARDVRVTRLGRFDPLAR